MIEIKIYRKKESYNPYKDETKRDWSLNDANNTLDTYQLLENGEVIFESLCQTVSNSEGIIPGARYLDTIAPGKFFIKLWQDKKKFHCDVHGITLAKTLGGEEVDNNFITPSSSDRWLQHDWQKLKPKPAGQDTRVAWSAGCIILPSLEQARLSELLKKKGLKPNDIVPTELFDEPTPKIEGDTELWKKVLAKASKNQPIGSNFLRERNEYQHQPFNLAFQL